jgi:hypothetical protein
MDGQRDKETDRWTDKQTNIQSETERKTKNNVFPDLLDSLVLVLLPHLVWSHSPHLPVDPGANAIYEALTYQGTLTEGEGSVQLTSILR